MAIENKTMRKQTAVEWLVENLYKPYSDTSSKKLDFNIILEQAKEIEKQQIIDAVGAPIIGEQYYNETFK